MFLSLTTITLPLSYTTKRSTFPLYKKLGRHFQISLESSLSNIYSAVSDSVMLLPIPPVCVVQMTGDWEFANRNSFLVKFATPSVKPQSIGVSSIIIFPFMNPLYCFPFNNIVTMFYLSTKPIVYPFCIKILSFCYITALLDPNPVHSVLLSFVVSTNVSSPDVWSLN